MTDMDSTFSDLGFGQFLIRFVILCLLLLIPMGLFGHLLYSSAIGAIYVLASLFTLRCMLPPAQGPQDDLPAWRYYLYGLVILLGGIGQGIVLSLMMVFIAIAMVSPQSVTAASLTVTLIIIATVIVASRLILREAAAACFKPADMTLLQASDHFRDGGLGAGPFLSTLTMGAGFAGFLLAMLFGPGQTFVTQGQATGFWDILLNEPRVLLLLLTTALLLCLHRPYLGVQLPRILNRFYPQANYPTVPQTKLLGRYGILMLLGYGILAYQAIWGLRVLMSLAPNL